MGQALSPVPAAAPLELRDVTTGYGDIAVVRGASMAFAARQVTSVIGSNGAGKSTAIKVAAGLLPAWKGSVFADGQDITGEAAYRRVSRGIGYVPQGRIVVPEMSVKDNLEIGAHILDNDRAAIEAALFRVVTLFPALKDRMKQHAGTMSGGEQQMLAIGRALMTSPKLLMLDEPSLGLSPKFVDVVFEKLLALRDAGMTIVMVEQKASRALAVSDQAYVMHLGRVAIGGSAQEILHNEDVKRLFLGEIPESLKLAEEDMDA
jgi:ABC-type branched-subunit amino acid transport system ATPase component